MYINKRDKALIKINFAKSLEPLCSALHFQISLSLSLPKTHGTRLIDFGDAFRPLKALSARLCLNAHTRTRRVLRSYRQVIKPVNCDK